MLGQQPLAVWSIAADYMVSNRYPEVRRRATFSRVIGPSSRVLNLLRMDNSRDDPSCSIISMIIFIADLSEDVAMPFPLSALLIEGLVQIHLVERILDDHQPLVSQVLDDHQPPVSQVTQKND
nr:hypothetical protein [Tanacetum cinerariifolium]